MRRAEVQSAADLLRAASVRGEPEEILVAADREALHERGRKGGREGEC